LVVWLVSFTVASESTFATGLVVVTGNFSYLLCCTASWSTVVVPYSADSDRLIKINNTMRAFLEVAFSEALTVMITQIIFSAQMALCLMNQPYSTKEAQEVLLKLIKFMAYDKKSFQSIASVLFGEVGASSLVIVSTG